MMQLVPVPALPELDLNEPDFKTFLEAGKAQLRACIARNAAIQHNMAVKRAMPPKRLNLPTWEQAVGLETTGELAA